MKTPNGDHGLVSLGKGIFLSKPKARKSTLTHEERAEVSNVAEEVPAPTVILIFGWMGANLPHLLKYLNAYNEMFPEAAKIIIRSEPSFFWSTKRSKNAYLAPVVEALEILGCLPPPASKGLALVRQADIEPLIPYPTPRVLVHTFSNGGSWQLVTFSDMLAARGTNYSQAVTPPSAVILDSCPGNGGVDGTLRAFSGVVRNPIGRQIARIVIRLIYLYLAFKRYVLKRPSTLDRMKARMNNERLLPWFGKNTRRLYIYSTNDDIIPAKEIEGHAKQAKDSGLDIRMQRFYDSGHVAHAKVYPTQYWAAVRELWEDTTRVDQSRA